MSTNEGISPWSRGAEPPRIAVLGALVADLTFWAPRRPEPGETLLGDRFEEFLGGKGFNQAVAAARLGADVTLVGAVGKDDLGDRFIEALDREGIDGSFIARVEGGTGVGQPLVTADGEVSILGIPRANGRLSAEMAQGALEAIAAADLLLLQCEVPLEANLAAARLARKHRTPAVLNPAPAGPDVRPVGPLASLLIVNLSECRSLCGDSGASAATGARFLASLYNCTVVVTLGEGGAIVAEDGELFEVASHPVEVVDPTGAGDAFCAAFSVATAEGASTRDALSFANAAGALAVGVAGAEPSMPSRPSVEELLLNLPETLDGVAGAEGSASVSG